MMVLTGATGFVGSQLLQWLGAAEDILLVSRNVEALRQRFPQYAVCDYASLPEQNLAGTTFVHLAARNNDQPGTIGDFRAANVDLLLDVAAMAKLGGAARFINLCSTHALDAQGGDLYGMSKAEGARKLAEYWPDGAVNLYVPAIYGNFFQGRLARLNQLPAIIRPIALSVLRLLKPTLSIGHLSQAINQLMSRRSAPTDPWSTEHYSADPVSNSGLYAAIKRMLDLLAAIGIIVIAGWVMILIAVYVRIDSKGPAIFAQRRVGRNGQPFTCYKFRTMTVGTAHAATHDISAAAVTSAGHFLRWTKLDELPQVANVLMNQMSLVGPRPCLPLQTELIGRRQARDVLRVKPGITGLAQVRHIDMSDPARLAAWDDRYCVFRTLAEDLLILIRTVLGGGAGDRTAPSKQPDGLGGKS